MAASMWESVEKDKNTEEVAKVIADRALGMPEFQELNKLEKMAAIKRARELLSDTELFPEIARAEKEAKSRVTESDQSRPRQKPLDFIIALQIVDALFPRKQK